MLPSPPRYVSLRTCALCMVLSHSFILLTPSMYSMQSFSLSHWSFKQKYNYPLYVTDKQTRLSSCPRMRALIVYGNKRLFTFIIRSYTLFLCLHFSFYLYKYGQIAYLLLNISTNPILQAPIQPCLPSLPNNLTPKVFCVLPSSTSPKSRFLSGSMLISMRLFWVSKWWSFSPSLRVRIPSFHQTESVWLSVRMKPLVCPSLVDQEGIDLLVMKSDLGISFGMMIVWLSMLKSSHGVRITWGKTWLFFLSNTPQSWHWLTFTNCPAVLTSDDSIVSLLIERKPSSSVVFKINLLGTSMPLFIVYSHFVFNTLHGCTIHSPF